MTRHPTEHPSDATLLSYAAGNLPPATAATAERHLADCPSCRETVEIGQQLGATLLSTIPGDPPTDAILADALRRLDLPPVGNRLPDPLDLSPEGGTWVGPGLRHKMLFRDATETLRLLIGEPGHAVPMHRHGGLELMLVLRGSFKDHRAEYLVGDVCEADEEVEHSPTVTGTEQCVCLVSHIGPLLFRSPLVRLYFKARGLL